MIENYNGLYLIRHKATGEYMPLYRRGKGYSHWNPSHPEKMIAAQNMRVLRLFKSRSQAIRVVRVWVANPNLERGHGYFGDGDTLKVQSDGRKIEDLEICPINIIIGEGEQVK